MAQGVHIMNTCFVYVLVSTVVVVMAGNPPPMIDNRAAKRARLLQLRYKLPHMSQSALQAIIAEAEREPLPVGVQRSDIREARDATCAQMTPYGRLHQNVTLPTLAGATTDIEFCAPLPMLYIAAATCKPFALLLMTALAMCPSTPTNPWSLIAYSDEIVPGNQLSYDNTRKSQAVYYSFKEFGQALSDEEAWFTAVAVRSSVVVTLAGQMSTFFGGFLKLFFNPRSHNASVAGINLTLHGGGTVRLFINFRVKVRDESAIRQVWQCKGAGGIKLCLLCKNVVQSKDPKATSKRPQRPLLEFDRSSLLVAHTESDCSKFDLHTKGSIMDVLQTLVRLKGSVPNDEFEAAETHHGWNDPTHSVLMDPDLGPMLDPSSQTCFDWAHCFCVHGIFNVVFGCMMTALRPLNITYATLHGYILLWRWPSWVGVRAPVLAEVFGQKRAKSSWKAKVLNASIGESLSLYAVVAQFIATAVVPTGRAPNVCNAYFAVCRVLDMLQVSGRRGAVAARDLQLAIRTFMDHFKAAFGDSQITPKFHHALHLPWFLEKFGVLVSCITHERKHRVVKKYLENLHNPRGLDDTLIRDCTCHHLQYLDVPNRFGLSVGLEEPIRECKGDLRTYLLSEDFGAEPHETMFTSKSARHAVYGRTAIGDVVAIDADDGLAVGLLQCLVEIDGQAVAFYQRFRLAQHVGLEFGYWAVLDTETHCCFLDQILETLIWSESDGKMTVLYPYPLRVGILRR